MNRALLQKFLKKPTAHIVISLVIIIGIVIALRLNSTDVLDAPVSAADRVITISTDTPDETPPEKSGFVWQGNNNDPKRIVAPSIGIDGYLQKVGLDQHNQIAVPNNVHMAGWYVGSARPGDKGLSIIDGHINGHINDGIFAKLSALLPGDRFSLELGSGKTLSYRVKEVQTVNLEDALNVLFSQDPSIDNQLNLITCGGNYLAKDKTYDHRIIAITEEIKNP